MRILDPAILAEFAAREGMVARLLVWIEARDRATGAPTPGGFWTGDDHQDFLIGGATRTYWGAGALLTTPVLQMEAGLKVRTHRLIFSPLAPEVAQVIRGYETRNARAEMHIAYFNKLTHALIAEPARVFNGFVSPVKITTPPTGGQAKVEVGLLSTAQYLTRTLAVKKSDESLRARAQSDGFRKYTTITGAVTTVWGEHKAAAPSPTTQTATPTPTLEEYR
jgi:hypothetical protein